MDIAFVNKCYDIFENQNIEKEQESIFFKSKEDYITKSHNQLFYKIQSTFTNNFTIQIIILNVFINCFSNSKSTT